MSNEVFAALVGAVAGAMSGGLVSWLLLRRQLKSARQWEMARTIAEILGPVLSAYTPDTLKTKEDVFVLQKAWGEKSRGLSLLGWSGGGSAEGLVNKEMNDYFQALIAFVDKKMSRGELEHRRAQCKTFVEQRMNDSLLR